ncbi:unnamed protein product [Candidula unifasciata]|uniref:CCHC-type domain-containing protein n=1 Tax=Candidula unifasciata TaxID=100452 RepID=A0A8S3ZU92_9EUPU|nr:unnamed protein product [Candidula unifasciata]
MVRKEKLCEWFKALPAHKRVDYLCGLLHMCHPLELRFTGTVLEDLAKKDFHYLREQEFKANQRADLSSNNSNSLSDQKLRAKIITALALMNSTNSPCAEVIFDILQQQFDNMLAMLTDSVVAADLIMILTMAVHHPAFTFYQKNRLGQILERMEERLQELYGVRHKPANQIETSRNWKSDPSLTVPADPSMTVPADPSVTAPANLAEPSPTKKGGAKYRIHTTWSNDEVTEVLLKFKQLQELHHKILNRFPEEKRTHASVPVFPGIQAHNNMESPSEQINALNTYFSKLVKAPAHILDCDILTGPLRSGTLVYRSRSASNPLISTTATMSSSSHTQAVFVQTSPLREGASLLGEDRKYEFAPYHQPIMMSYPSVIPHSHYSSGASQNSSAANSPINSGTSSPAPVTGNLGSKISYTFPGSVKDNSGAMSEASLLHPVPNADQVSQLLSLLNMEEYVDNLKDYPFQQLIHMSKEDLAKAGLSPEAQAKLKCQLDKIRPEINGMVDATRFPSTEPSFYSPLCYHHPPYTLIAPHYPQHFIHPFTAQAGHIALLPSPQPHLATNESSPANSDTSSPPASPQQPLAGLVLDHPLVGVGSSYLLSPLASATDGSEVKSMGRSTNSYQLVDSSGSEEEKKATGNNESGAFRGKGHARPQQSRSLPLINQGQLPVTTMEAARLTGMPISMSAPHSHPAIANPETRTAMTPPLQAVTAPHVAANSTATLVNGYISDPPPVLPHAASGVVPRGLLNSRTYKTAQPAHTSLGVHKSVMNMPAPDLSHPLSNLGKNSASTNSLPLLHSNLGPQTYSMGPPLTSVPPTHLMGPALTSVPPTHLLGLSPVNFSPNNIQLGHQASPTQALLPDGNGGAFPLLMYPRGILTTVANATPIMATTQTHHTGPPMSHSPSPAATAIGTDQLPAAPYMADPLDPSRSDSSSHTPPVQTPVHLGAVQPLANTGGTNSGTPSPPLVPPASKPVGPENQPGVRPQVIGIISGFMPQVLYPQQGHQPPPQFPNGITSDYGSWLRFPAQINSNHFPFVYGSVIPHQNLSGSFHTTPNSGGQAALTNQSHAAAAASTKGRCYNCGLAGHKSSECHENRMENMTNSFHLSYKPSDPPA